MKVFIQDQSDDHNFENVVDNSIKPVEFIGQIRQQGGYYVLDKEQNVVFVPWHNIHSIRFVEE